MKVYQAYAGFKFNNNIFKPQYRESEYVIVILLISGLSVYALPFFLSSLKDSHV